MDKASIQNQLKTACDKVKILANKPIEAKILTNDDKFVNKVLEYDLIDGVIVDILVNKIQQSFEKKKPVEINKKQFINIIRETLKKKYKMFLDCELSKTDVNIYSGSWSIKH